MNKEEFLNKLRKKLNVLEDSEIEDIISEYEGYIEEKVNAGLSEEEAVKELGNINEIVSDLLAAYKVKTPSEENSWDKLLNNINRGIDSFLNSLNDKSGKDILKVLIEVIIVLLFIGLLKIPFALIRDLGANIFIELGSPIGNIFNAIWSFIIEFSYVIVSIILFIKILEKRYFKDVTEKIITKREIEKEQTSNKETKKESEKVIEKVIEKSEINDNEPVRKTKERNSLLSIISNICLIFLKIIVILILLGVIGYLLGMAIAIGLGIYLIAQGVAYYGIFLLLVALFLGGVFVLEFGINFCFNKKFKPLNFFSKLVTLIILTGVGLSLSAVEIANTEIIYDNYYQETKNVTKDLDMRSDLTFYNYDTLIEDNSLNDKVKIEYVYPDLKDSMSVSIDLEECGKGYCLETDINQMRWSKVFLNDFIKNLKNKKIHTYEFKVEKIIYASEENINIIRENNHNANWYNKPVTFTKNYNILNIAQSNDEEYLYLTIREFQGEEIETVKVLKSIALNVEIGKNYEFSFSSIEAEPNDDIKEIFEESSLIEIISLESNET